MGSRPGLNSELIVQAAAELADNLGLDRLTLSAVAEHLGVRTPSLYNHIEGLDRLKHDLSILGLTELDRRLQRAALGKAGDQALASMLHAYRRFAKDRPGVYEATLHAPLPDDEQRGLAAKGIIDTVLTVLEPYHLDFEDAIHVVRGFRAIGHGFATLEGADGFAMALSLEESYQRLIETFLLGLNMLAGGSQPESNGDEKSESRPGNQKR